MIISNASEDSTAAVNALLKAGKKVAMVTGGQYEGDFLCSYADWLTVAGDYVLTGTGVVDANVTAHVIEKAPTVYISGTAKALTQNASGYTYTTLVASSYAYNYDRMALDMMNFSVTEDATQADAVIGASGLDSAALAARPERRALHRLHLRRREHGQRERHRPEHRPHRRAWTAWAM